WSEATSTATAARAAITATIAACPSRAAFRFAAKADGLAHTQVEGCICWARALVYRNPSEVRGRCRKICFGIANYIRTAASKPRAVVEDGISVIILASCQIVGLTRIDNDE